jgi:hypothetical protein
VVHRSRDSESVDDVELVIFQFADQSAIKLVINGYQFWSILHGFLWRPIVPATKRRPSAPGIEDDNGVSAARDGFFATRSSFRRLLVAE